MVLWAFRGYIYSRLGIIEVDDWLDDCYSDWLIDSLTDWLAGLGCCQFFSAAFWSFCFLLVFVGLREASGVVFLHDMLQENAGSCWNLWVFWAEEFCDFEHYPHFYYYYYHYYYLVLIVLVIIVYASIFVSRFGLYVHLPRRSWLGRIVHETVTYCHYISWIVIQSISDVFLVLLQKFPVRLWKFKIHWLGLQTDA